MSHLTNFASHMPTHKPILSLLFFTLLISCVYAQSKEDRQYRFFSIKKLYQEINAYKQYTTVTIDDAEILLGHGTDNGASLTGYFKNDTLKKMVEWVGLSNKVIQNEYYISKGKLVFVYTTESSYNYNDSTQSFDYSKLILVFTGRYYFKNDKLIDSTLSNKEKVNLELHNVNDFIADYRKYTVLLKNKNR